MFEAVPNISEGRDYGLIGAIADTVASVEGVMLLDVSSDPDHNRTVLTYVSEREDAIVRATLGLFEIAVRNIDLRSHDGEHPRVGAVDVCPFVPLQESSMDSCVRLSERVGIEVNGRFGVPVFLYEAAARAEHRRALPAIRRGGLDGLREKMSGAEWRPDFGQAELHPSAGVSVIGARDILVAFNMQLETDDLEVARAVARATRQSSRGLPEVRALGMRLSHRDLVQVSMNLLDFRVTGLLTAFERVSELAAQRGVAIRSSEIVGLAPRAAMPDDPRSSILLEDHGRRLVLEDRIEEVSKGLVRERSG